MRKRIARRNMEMNRRTWMQALIILGAVCAVCSALWAQAGSPTEKAVPIPDRGQLQSATTHPMKYYISLPPDWSSDRTWPVLVAPSAHYAAKSKTIELFAPLRDARKARLIIVAPLVINSDPVAGMKEYRGAVMDSISAADAAPAAEGRDEEARAKFDSEGIMAVIKDVKSRYHAEDKFYITGFSASTHIAYMFLFSHPELLKGVVVNSGVYLGRGVDESHIPLLNSPERAKLDVLFLVGAKDPPSGPNMGLALANWHEARAKLLSYGHSAAKLREEVIQPGNPEKLSAGHNWFPTKILDFCDAIDGAGNSDVNSQKPLSSRPSPGRASIRTAPLADKADGTQFNRFTDSTGLVGQYLLYRPTGLSPHIPVPIVISLPGGGPATSQKDRTQFIPKAKEKGFVAVFISGVNTNSHSPWNATNDPTQPNVVRFINELIDHLKSDQNGGDVFLCGFSGGAMMTHTMACLAPQKIRAFGSCAGAIYTHFGTKPTVPVSLIEIHALNDLNVNVNGLINGKRGTSTHTSLEATFSYYKQVDGIDDSSLVTTPVATPYLNGCVTKQTWSNAANGTKLELIVLNKMLPRPQSHHWPLPTDAAPFTGFDATSAMWDFFSQFITRPSVQLHEE